MGTLSRDTNSTLVRNTAFKKIDLSQSAFKDTDKATDNPSMYEMNSKFSSINETNEPESETKVDLGAIQASEMRKRQVLVISNRSAEDVKDSCGDKKLSADVTSENKDDEESYTYI